MFLIILFILDIFVTQSVEYQNLYLQQNETFQQEMKQLLIIESNNSDVSLINSIGYDLIKQSFMMEQFLEGQLLQVLFMNSFEFLLDAEHCVCQLIHKQSQYYIKCIDGVKINEEQNQLQKNTHAKTYEILLTSTIEEQCEEMELDSFKQIIIYCQKQNKYIIYRINLKAQSINIILESDFQYFDCQRKIILQQKTLYLAFYNCSNWVVFDLSNDKEETIINQKIVESILTQIQVKFNNLNNIHFCQSRIFLIIQNWYLEFSFLNENLQFQNSFKTSENNISYLAFQACRVTYVVSEFENQENNTIIFNQEHNEISLKKGYCSHIYSTPSYLLLMKGVQIQLIITKNFNQTYTMNSSKLYFLNSQAGNKLQVSMQNLFYYINSKGKLQFYQLQNLQESMKPKSKYLLLVQQFNIFNEMANASLIFYRLVRKFEEYLNLNPNGIFQTIEINNRCQFIGNSILPKNKEYAFEFTQIQAAQEKNSIKIIGIKDELDFYSYFFGLQKYQIKQILWIDNQTQNYYKSIAFISKKDEFFILNSYQQILYQEKLEGKLIFNTYGQAVLLKLQDNLIIGIFCLQEVIRIIRNALEEKILRVNKCLDVLVITLENTKTIIYDLKTHKIVYLDDEFYQFGNLICYFKLHSAQIIIQFEKLIIYKINEYDQKVFSFPKVFIQEIVRSTNGWKIKAIQTSTNSIVTYYVDEHSLVNNNQFIFENEIQLLNPLVVSISNQIFAIASFLNGERIILIAVVKNYIKTLKVIKVANFYFQYIGGKLIFFNTKDQLILFDADNYYLTYENIANQKNFVNHYVEGFVLNYKENNSSFSFEGQINFNVRNNCYKIAQLIDVFKSSKQIFFFSPSDIFDGPITDLAVNTKEIQLTGPYQINMEIKNCEENTIEFCQHAYKVYKTYHNDYNSIYCIQNKLNLQQNKIYFCDTYLQSKEYFFKFLYVNHSNIIASLIILNDWVHIFIYEIDEAQSILKEKYTQLLSTSNATMDKNIKICNNLILIQIYDSFLNSNFLFEITHNKQLEQVHIFRLLDFQSIDFTEGNYAMLNYNQFNEFKSEIKIVSIQNLNITIISTLSLDSMMHNTFKDHFFSHEILYFQESPFKKIKKCVQENRNTVITLFLLLNHNYYELEIKFDQLSNQTEGRILNVFRCPQEATNIIIHHFEDSILILKDQQLKHYYFYDTSIRKPMNDYIFQLTNFTKKIYQINTTHYFIVEKNNVFIGQIGFKINILNKNYQNNGFLIANNDVSMAKVQIVYDDSVPITFSQIFCKIGIFFISLILIILGVKFFFRRQKLKQANIRNIDQLKN